MKRWAAFGALVVGAVLLSHAQTTPARPAFEVASIKPGANCDAGGSPISVSPGRLGFHCIPLRNLIGVAYGTFAGDNISARRLAVVGGPHWIDTDRYDISAKAEGGASGPQMMGPMLQALLEDRFQVRAHVGSQDSPVYALTVAKNSPRLQPSKEGSCVPFDLNNTPRTAPKPGEQPKYCGFPVGGSHDGVNYSLDWYATTMAELASRGLSMVDRPVIDQTGLNGRFDFHLEFVLDDPGPGRALLNGQPSPGIPASPDDPAGPSIFTALEQQVGLKLSPARGPLDVIIVDRAEKPSEN